MEHYRITITSTQPLLMHADSIEWADEMERWKNDKDNKKGSKAGDDRSPAWRWLGCLYHDGEHVTMSTDNIMRCLMEGGAMVPVPGGVRGKTFKSQSQSGMQPSSTNWALLIKGRPIPVRPLLEMVGQKDFEAHQKIAEKNGFRLFLKRAKIGQSKHIRVRPRFEEWGLVGGITVTDEQITHSVLQDIVEMAGRYKGLGDWRPGAKTPGPFGMFVGKVERQ